MIDLIEISIALIIVLSVGLPIVRKLEKWKKEMDETNDRKTQ